LGLRILALIIAGAGLLLSLGFAIFSKGDGHWIHWGIAAAICAASLVYWWLSVTPEWVRRAAELYADRLLEAVDTLDSENP
jgi:hypothetical protein